MRLYEINKQIESILDDVDLETGEISESAFELLNQIEIEKEKKVLNIGKYLKSLDAESEAFANEIKTLQARKKSIDNRYESIKNYLSNEAQGQIFKDAQCAITWLKSESVEVSGIIADDYMRIKKEPDLTKIKSAIKSGLQVDGAKIIEKQNIQIK